MKKLVSIVIPCLNEEQTIKKVITSCQKTLRVLQTKGYRTELLIIDNNSNDTSKAIIQSLLHTRYSVEKHGYGRVYQYGISLAKGSYICIMDSDASYHAKDIPTFVTALEQHHDLVLGSRFKGRIISNAMPWSHRYIGNPLFTFFINSLFHTNLTDIHTGMRAFTKSCYRDLRLTSSGMEFASEMIIKAVMQKKRILELPITYYPRLGKSKLRIVKDSIRHCICIGHLYTRSLFKQTIV